MSIRILEQMEQVRSNPIIQRMLNKSKETRKHTKKVERALIRQSQEGCEESRDKLLTKNSPFVLTIAAQYSKQSYRVDAMWNAGMVGLDVAISRYQLDKFEHRLISYAVWWVRQKIRVYINEEAHEIRIPAHLVGAYNKARSEIESSIYDPRTSPVDLAELCGVTDSQASALSFLVGARVALDGEHGDGGGTITPHELVADGATAVGGVIADLSDREWLAGVCRAVLTARELRVLHGRFYEDRTLESIGGEIGLSRERVRQVEANALEKVRRRIATLDRRYGVSRSERLNMIEKEGGYDRVPVPVV